MNLINYSLHKCQPSFAHQRFIDLLTTITIKNFDVIFILPKEDAERESQLLDDDPGLVAKKFNLECARVSYWIKI